MPVRPELSLAVQRPKLYDPGQVLSLRDLAQQGEMRRMQMEDLEAQRADRQALKQIYGQPGAVDTQTGLPTPETLPKIGAIKPELVPEIAKQQLTLDKLRAETDRARAGAQASQVEIGIKKENLLNEMVRGPALAAYDEATKTMPPEQAARVAQMAYSEGMERAGRSGLFSVEERGQFPLDFNPDRVRQRLMQSKDWMAIQTGQRTREESERHNRATEAQRARDATETERRHRETEARARDVALQASIAAAKEQAKARATSEAQLPTLKAKADDAIKLIDQMVGSVDGKIKPHPGFEDYVGATWKPGMRLIEGSDAANFEAMQKQLTGGAFLQAFETLKGGGQITQIEGEKATAAILRMNKAQSEKEFKAAARDFQNNLRRGMKLAAQKAGEGRQDRRATDRAPDVGTVMDGYRFNGGDPSNRNNWEKVGG